MDESVGHEISDISRWWSLCLLILPISIFLIIWVASTWPFGFGGIWFIIILIVCSGIIVIPLLVDHEYRVRVIQRIRGTPSSHDFLHIPEETDWSDPSAIQVWPIIRSVEGEPVSSRSHVQFYESRLLSIPVIEQKLPELEEAINELDAQVETYLIAKESRRPNREQLMIERSAANQLLTSLLIQRGKKTVTPQFYRRKRRWLLRTIEQIDIALGETKTRTPTKLPG